MPSKRFDGRRTSSIADLKSRWSRVLAGIVTVVLLASGVTVLGASSAQADQSYGVISGTVSFAAAPSWDTAGKSFTVALIGPDGQEVPRFLVPISYGYDGAGGYTISYPNSSGYYNDYFQPGSYFYTVRISPWDGAYPVTYLGGASTPDSATQLDLSSLPSTKAAGNTKVAILASVSGTVTAPNGFPAGGIQAGVCQNFCVTGSA